MVSSPSQPIAQTLDLPTTWGAQPIRPRSPGTRASIPGLGDFSGRDGVCGVQSGPGESTSCIPRAARSRWDSGLLGLGEKTAPTNPHSCPGEFKLRHHTGWKQHVSYAVSARHAASHEPRPTLSARSRRWEVAGPAAWHCPQGPVGPRRATPTQERPGHRPKGLHYFRQQTQTAQNGGTKI